MRRALAGVVLLLTGVGCVDESFQIGDEGYELPATLEDVVAHAQTVATGWDPDAYLWGMGGDFTVTDSAARAYDHSYRFYSIRQKRRLDLHMFSGTPYATDRSKWPPPTPVSVNQPVIGSAEAVATIVQAARDFGITIPENLTARFLGFPVWPENDLPDNQVVAWRVDLLELRPTGPPGQQILVWWSVMRGYVDPANGDILEVIRREEVYPRFDNSPPP
jgi:hypothetical protein